LYIFSHRVAKAVGIKAIGIKALGIKAIGIKATGIKVTEIGHRDLDIIQNYLKINF